ncbi:MAG: hypothetical protein ACUVSY_11900, partial [Roseiflexus sp.]
VGFFLHRPKGALVFLPFAALFFPVAAQLFQYVIKPALGLSAVGEMLLHQSYDKLPEFGIMLQDGGQFLENDGPDAFALWDHDLWFLLNRYNLRCV